MAELIERQAADKALTLSAANDKDKKPPYMGQGNLCFARSPCRRRCAVVHGSWISWEEADNFIPSARRHECSVCHDAAQVLVNGFELLSDYCPNCGARMDGDCNAAD